MKRVDALFCIDPFLFFEFYAWSHWKNACMILPG